jgi:hypothetical protein
VWTVWKLYAMGPARAASRRPLADRAAVTGAEGR